MAEPPSTREVWRWYAAQTGLFVVSRAVAHAAGVRFDPEMFQGCWQCIDFSLLRTDALRSLYWFHAQPPLYNAWIALSLQQHLLKPRVFLTLSLHASALALVLAVMALGRRLLPSTAQAFVLGAVFSLGPALLIFEQWPQYTVPTAALVALAGWLIARGSVGLALAAMVLTCWLRASFHPLWVVAAAAPIAAVAAIPRRPLAARIAAAALLAALPSLRNAVHFGVAQQSTWFGMNLARAALPTMSLPEREVEVRAGRLSTVALVAPFSGPQHYPDVFARAVAPSDAPVLNELRLRTGLMNLNHVGYIEVSRRYAGASRQVIAAHPLRYLGRALDSALIYGHSPSGYLGASPNGRRLLGWRRVYDAAVLGVPSAWVAPLPLRMRPSAGSVTWALLALAGFGAVRGTRELVARRRSLGLTDAALAYALITTAYAALVSCLFEYGENQRYRFEVEALLFLFAALGLGRLVNLLAPRVLRRFEDGVASP